MSYQFEYTVKIRETLSIPEKMMVYEHLSSHPDTTFLTLEGQFGYSLVNFHDGEEVNRAWSFREIDSILKSFEYPLPDIDNKLKAQLFTKLCKWAEAINDKVIELQST